MNNFNVANLTGKITDVQPAFLTKSGNVCTRCSIEIMRLSTEHDVLQLIIPDTVMKHMDLVNAANCDNSFTVKGHVRTANYQEGAKRRLQQYIYVENIVRNNPDDVLPENDVVITGVICRDIRYRHTPLGRIVADVFIAHNPEGKHTSYYIPCIAWGKTGIALTNYKVGDVITVYGRYQSRWYKKLINDKVEDKLAYELSISKFEVEHEIN